MKPRVECHSVRVRRGVSVVEMMVAGCVGLLVVSIAVNVLSWVGRGASKARARDQGIRELKMATDHIARDLGLAVAIQQYTDNALRLAIDGAPFDGETFWAAPDRIIEYRLTGEGLVRHDRLAEDSFVVARPIASFTVDEALEGGVETLLVDLVSTRFGETSSATLRLHLP